MIRSLFLVLLRLIPSLTLLVSGSIHLANPYYFLEDLYAYQIIPQSIVAVSAAFLICLSLVVGLALLFELNAPNVYIVATFMFSLFFGVQSISVLRGLTIDCGCFGAASGEIGWQSVVLAGCLAFISFICYRLSTDPKG